ncbi:hypothetical protein N7456_013317 [Penicillium angulare]|uniref:Uncharacterized protein n=1 Tax=Penicillium angulare TaxID=116970 RepID=A0A9W9EG15_9EURO|nr:hypothetical protein N7456_013317 [Penicillium angulare]
MRDGSLQLTAAGYTSKVFINYINTECSGDDKFSLPMMEAPFALDKFANFNEKFNSMSMPANGKSVYCTSESHSP